MNDWQTFLKLDHAGTMQLLTSFASGLAQENLVTERQVQTLTDQLTAMTPKLSHADESLLTLLMQEDSEFIEILTTRYSVTGLAWNHLRMSTKNLLAESTSILVQWSDQVLKKAELFMNRAFIANQSSPIARRELYPSVLGHLAKGIHDAAKELQLTILEFSLMRPADILDTTGQQFDAELRVALQTGFSGLEPETLTYCRVEQRAIRNITQAFDDLAQTILQIVSGLKENSVHTLDLKALESECEILSAQCQQFSGLRFEMSRHLRVTEIRRLGFLHEIFSINHRLSRMARLFSGALSPKDHVTYQDLLSGDVKRAVAYHLIQHGLPAGFAMTAANDLMNYCLAHHEVPEHLIPGELKKINPDLTEDALKFAAGLTSKSLVATPGGSGEKSRFLASAAGIRKSLMTSFPFAASRASTLTMVFVVVILTSYCGLKTSVVSNLKDPRAEVDFHLKAPPKRAPTIVAKDLKADPKTPGTTYEK